MHFRDAKSIAEGLKSWREEYLKKTRREVREHGNKTKVLTYSGEQQLERYENGKAFPHLDLLIEGIFPAYEIHSIDRFLLGYCPPRLHGLSEVQHLREGRQIRSEERYGGTVRHGISDPKFLGRVPIRVDRFVIPKGKKSETIRHSGYNYLLVIRGSVRCHLEEEDGGKSNQKPYDLKSGDALLFPTKLWHSIEATGVEDEAEFVVASPGWAHEDVQEKPAVP